MQQNTDNDAMCTDYHVEETRGRGRTEIRKTFIYKDISEISNEWIALRRLIRVDRYVYKKSHEYAIERHANNVKELFELINSKITNCKIT